jgi:hypothetical protein
MPFLFSLFGDTADLVVIGGRRDVRDEEELGIGKL